MKFGIIPIEGGSYYNEFLEQALAGEELGFDSVWLEEHHGIRNHYWPSPLICLAGLATRTKRILIGTDIVVLPFYHPVRLAEDTAMLEIISQGRFILGAAIGYNPSEFALYQVPMERRGAVFEESLQVIRLLWTQDEVNFEGNFHQIHGLRIEPRPSRPIPIWLGGWGELSLQRAAKLGDAWIPGPTADLEKLLKAQKDYHEQLQRIGVSPASRTTPLTRETIIAETDQEARLLAEKHLMISYRDEYGGGKWKHPLIGGQDSTAVDQFNALEQDRFLVGNPETIIKKILNFKQEFKMDHLISRLYFPGLSHEFIMKEIHLLAKEVLPVFK